MTQDKPAERDIYECANQLGGYIGPNTDAGLARFLRRESDAAAALADEIVRLRSALSQAYERGQVDMRERADAAAKYAIQMPGNDQWARGYHAAGADISLSIRSLPIEQEGE